MGIWGSGQFPFRHFRNGQFPSCFYLRGIVRGGKKIEGELSRVEIDGMGIIQEGNRPGFEDVHSVLVTLHSD